MARGAGNTEVGIATRRERTRAAGLVAGTLGVVALVDHVLADLHPRGVILYVRDGLQRPVIRSLELCHLTTPVALERPPCPRLSAGEGNQPTLRPGQGTVSDLAGALSPSLP